MCSCLLQASQSVRAWMRPKSGWKLRDGSSQVMRHWMANPSGGGRSSCARRAHPAQGRDTDALHTKRSSGTVPTHLLGDPQVGQAGTARYPDLRLHGRPRHLMSAEEQMKHDSCKEIAGSLARRACSSAFIFAEPHRSGQRAWTRSKPVTSSVHVCSTCQQGPALPQPCASSSQQVKEGGR